MSLRSPRSPLSSPTDFSRRGFKPLPISNEDNMSYESDIQLSAVPRRSTSSTGARKQGDGIPHDFSSASTFKDDEKKGFFGKGAGGKRKGPRPTRIGSDGEEQEVNAIGRFYNKIVNFSIVTRYLVYVFPVAIVLAVPLIIYAVFFRTYQLVDTTLLGWIFFLWLEIVWLSLWISKLFAKAVPWAFMALCGVVSSGTRKYATVLRAVEIPISLVGWAATCLLTFHQLTLPGVNKGLVYTNSTGATFNSNPDAGTAKWITVVENLLLPAFFASLLLLGEKMVIQLISINYHRRSFDARIKESKQSVHLLGLLYDASRTLFPSYCPEFREEDYIINDGLEAILAKIGGHSRKASAAPMKIIGNIGRMGDKVTSVFNSNSAHSVVIEALEKTSSSEALAKRLWMSFVVEGKESLYSEDLQEVLGVSRRNEAEEAFNVLDNDGNGDISLEEMIMKVVEIGRDRKSISSSMRDVGQAIGVLDNIMIWVLLVIVVFIFVAFQNTNFVTTLATAGTTLLSLSFVFAATTQEFLGSCIFLFVKHPFDVGDRVDIVGSEKEFLVVEQISLLYTLFKRIDSMKMVQVPNIVLNNLWIENITRSKAMKEQLDMFISFDTSLEDLEILRDEMEKFVRHPDNSRDFQPDFTLEATGIGSMNQMQLRVEIRHKSNWHNEAVRASRRSKFMCALVLALRKVPIYGPGGGSEALGGPNNPGYSVSITDSWAAEARAKAAKAKEGKRLVPTPIAVNPQEEAAAAAAMNQRNPIDDPAHQGGLDPKWTRGGGDDDDLDPRDETETLSLDLGNQGLMKRKSTRGRRRAGDALPDSATHSSPTIDVTAPDPTPTHPSRNMLDEESEVGLQQANAASPLDGYANYQQTQPGGYSTYPPASRPQSYQQYQQPSQPIGLHPLGSAPASSNQTYVLPPPQGRIRRLSLSVKPGNSKTDEES